MEQHYQPERIGLMEINATTGKDVERNGNDDTYLHNESVGSFQWSHISVTIQDKVLKKEKYLLRDVSGSARAGEVIAILGPSGSGKTTLLNVLASRPAAAKADVRSNLFVNRVQASRSGMQKVARYVEQEDSLIGSLTARETLDFAAKLGMPGRFNKRQRLQRVDEMLASFGLTEQAGTIVGTPIRKGLSGGQKRRVSVASQLITAPKILFLDEPTSGLDSAASYEVMAYLKAVAKKNKIIVIATIHQPSASTYDLFDKVFLLSRGKLCYGGPRIHIPRYFSDIGFPVAEHVNVPEFLLDLVNTDFSTHSGSSVERLARITSEWKLHSRHFTDYIPSQVEHGPISTHTENKSFKESLRIPLILLHRNYIKSYRDVFAYGIRLAMYLGLAFMMGTVWLRLGTSQEYIQPYINAIFFGSAFMSFMAVAYVPAYLEDRAMFIKERRNNLYTSPSFLLANFLIGLPYLFSIAFLFSLVSYFLVGFRSDGSAFFKWVLWIFLDLLAAESLVVLVASLVPIFVVALAAIAFANGLWMAVGGFLVSPSVLNVFWKYWARYIDYQSYVFQGMMVNEFASRTYGCAKLPDDSCQCMYTPLVKDRCTIPGQAVLDSYGFAPGWDGLHIGILLCIVLAYRLLALLVLWWKKT